MKAKHTPGPWEVKKCCCGHKSCKDYWIEPPGKFMQGSGFTKADADRIVKCVNIHDELLKSLKSLVKASLEADILGLPELQTAVGKANKAIAAAEGEQ